MKKLTLKEFLKYNSPCFACGGKVDVMLHFTKLIIPHVTGQIKCYVTSKETKIPLKIGYSNSLELKVTHKDNIFSTNDLDKLVEYFTTHEVMLHIKCPNTLCESSINSSMINLNYKFFRLEPIYVVHEFFNIKMKNKCCVISTNHLKNVSTISLYDLDNQNDIEVFSVSVPAFNITKFKNKEKLFEKMKTYVTFS